MTPALASVPPLPPEELQAKTYPPAPWKTKGRVWVGAYRVDNPPPLPPGFRPLFSANWVSVLLIRYLEGTLRYDELAITQLVRRGHRLGVHVHAIWVDSEASREGGRRIWGLPKRMANFAWVDGGTVRVTDREGLVATVNVSEGRTLWPRLFTPSPCFGLLDGQRTYAHAFMKGRLRRSQMRIEEWSKRFPYSLAGPARLGMAIDPMAFKVNAPRIIK